MNKKFKLQKTTILSIMIALDFILSPLFRIEGMAPMSSVMNVIAAVMIGPYAILMAVICAFMRMLILGIPPLALTGALFGSILASYFYRLKPNIASAVIGEIIGTGLIGSLASYPVMVFYTGTSKGLFWFVFTPKFFGGAISGSIIAIIILINLRKNHQFKRIQSYFKK